MNKTRTLALALALTVGGWTLATAAQAATVTRIQPGHVGIAGDIVPGDLARLRRIARPGDYIWLNSYGGNVLEGVQMANYIRANSMNTGVVSGHTCASICVTILAGGVGRTVSRGARVAVHSAGGRTASGRATGEDLTSQGITLLMARHLSRMGAPDRVVVRVVLTENSTVYILTAADLQDWVNLIS